MSQQKKQVIVITGVPGSGKTFFSNLLKKKVKAAEVIHVTEVVNKKKLFSSYTKDGSKLVKMDKLQTELQKMIKRSNKRIIILESHLLCDIKIGNAKAIVLREHLGVIRNRLSKRGYGKGKLEANLVSEATDYCGQRSANNYSYVFESFARDKKLLSNALQIMKGKKPKSKEIDLLPELSSLIKRGRGPML